jgi:hypothetical protein
MFTPVLLLLRLISDMCQIFNRFLLNKFVPWNAVIFMESVIVELDLSFGLWSHSSQFFAF